METVTENVTEQFNNVKTSLLNLDEDKRNKLTVLVVLLAAMVLLVVSWPIVQFTFFFPYNLVINTLGSSNKTMWSYLSGSNNANWLIKTLGSTLNMVYFYVIYDFFKSWTS